MRTQILIALLGGLIFGFLVGWNIRNDGKIIASAQNIHLPGNPKIIIRQISETGSFYGRWFDTFEDNYLYRFEYYIYSSGVIYSCQTYSGSSYRANSAQVEWEPTGAAVVSLDHSPKFKCDSRGTWERL